MRPGWQPKAATGSAASSFPAVVRRRPIAAVLVLLFVAASWFIFSSSTLFKSSPPHYVLVIDAGSSGTRMNAFTWHPPSSLGNLPQLHAIPPDAAPHKIPRRALETRRAYTRVETEPGMDKFAENVGKLGQKSLEPLLEWSRAVIPRSSWANTPVFLFGTAGLRKLSENQRERVMNEAKSVLRRCGFRFEDGWARVLGGNDEGIYAWVALNAAEGKLGTGNTLGALDLGGSSLQVTFAMDTEDNLEGKNAVVKNEKNGSGGVLSSSSPPSVNVSLLGVHHTLYTHSHHHFGLDDAFERSVSILLEEQASKNSHTTTSGKINLSNGGSDKIGKRRRRELLVNQPLNSAIELEHPCLHKGYNKNYNRIPLEGRIPSPTMVTLIGAPDLVSCSRLASKVVTTPTECDAPPCALGTPQPRVAGKFIALAGFYVVSHFFKLGAKAGVAAVAQAGTAFCPLTWAEVQSRHAGEMAVETYCFRTAYIAALIPQGLGLKEEQVEIGEGTAGWTLGAALVEGHRHAGLGGDDKHTARSSGSIPGSINTSTSSKVSTAVSNWSESVLPTWGGRTAAGILAVFIVAALVLSFKRGQDAVSRAFRGDQGWVQGQSRRRSSSGILSAAEFGAQELSGGGNNSSGFFNNVFFRLIGAAPKGGSTSNTAGKRASPGSSAFWPPGSNENTGSSSYDSSTSLSAVGSSRALGLTRSATYSRRLSALETASSERGG